jgi:hypothetical protein
MHSFPSTLFVWTRFDFRSTNLDGWQAEQIKRVLAGGNPAAHDFFKKQGMGSDVQGETKYTSRAGQLYRAHLDKLAQCVFHPRVDSSFWLFSNCPVILRVFHARLARVRAVVLEVGGPAAAAAPEPVGGMSGLEELESQFAAMAAPSAAASSAAKPAAAKPVAAASSSAAKPAVSSPAHDADAAAKPAGPVVIKRDQTQVKAASLSLSTKKAFVAKPSAVGVGASSLDDMDFDQMAAQASASSAAAASASSSASASAAGKSEDLDAFASAAAVRPKKSNSILRPQVDVPVAPTASAPIAAKSASAPHGIPGRSASGSGASGSNPYAAADSAKLNTTFAKAKAIGSDAFFDRGDDRAAVQAKLSQYKGSSAISSDSYFDREPAEDELGTSPDSLGTIDLGDAINAVADQAEQLKKAASDWMNSFSR